MRNILILSSIVILALSSCTKKDCGFTTLPATPQCIQTKLATFQLDAREGYKLESYTFQSGTVYAFDYGSISDGPVEVYDMNCQLIGVLNAFAGETNINGIEFYSNAVFIQTIWQK